MSTPPACLLIVTAEIDPAVEAEWNDWYDNVHLPDALACPGVLSGNRYVSVSDGAITRDGKKSTDPSRVYVAIYELSGPEALDTPEFGEMRGWYQFSDKITAHTRVFAKR
jgi:hypothetical protein